MPVTHQWKPKPKPEEPAPAPQSPPTQPAGKKSADADDQSGRKGRFASKKDEKAAAAAAKDAESDDSDKSGDEDQSGQPGRIRNLAGFFATQKDDPKNVRKKRFEVAEDPEAIILENEPERLEGVIRADDPGEWQKPIELEKGWAKNMASMFLNRGQEDSFTSKKPFKMDIDENAQTIVLENEPVRLEGVVRSVDKTEDVIGKRGRIKNIAGRFTNPQPEDDEETSGGGGKPKWLLELESAKEYGVFENEPEVRSDVVRADDEQPDVISAQHTRNLRKMWSQIEKEEVRDAAPKKPDILIRPKKKEPSPEPEPPPPPPVEETKPTRRFGGGGNIRGAAGAFGTVYGKAAAKKEKTPPPPEPEPPKPETRRGFRHAQKSTQPAPAPAPVPEPVAAPAPVDPKNPFKTALKPVPRRK